MQFYHLVSTDQVLSENSTPCDPITEPLQAYSSLHSSSIDQQRRMDFFRSQPDAIKLILEKLSLRDVVLFHYGCSKECRELTSSRVFEGEPFFLRYSSLEPSPSYYAFSLQRWVQLLLPTGLPVSFRHLRPVSTSGGLVLFSGVPGYDKVLQLRQWWPLVVVNPITRENRLLLFLLELPPEFVKDDTLYPEYYSDLLMGLKVNADSKTYKVVVHWKNKNVVQIFDSGSHQWSTLSAPTELEAYANSSNEIVFCRSYGQDNALRSSAFDIGHGKLVDCRFRGGMRAANVNPSRNRFTARSTPTIVGESCLYVVSYKVFPVTYVRIHKKERSNINWQLVTEVPWEDLCISLKFSEKIGDAILSGAVLDIYECGKHLLFTFTLYGIWGGALYDLEKQVWNPHFVMKRYPGPHGLVDGLFFQPQLNGPPC